MDPLPESGSAVVEIYTRIYLRRAGMPGSKLRSRAALNLALEGLGSPPARLRFEPNDHQTDALVAAAGMRALAKDEPRAFDPEGLTPQIAQAKAGRSACYKAEARAGRISSVGRAAVL